MTRAAATAEGSASLLRDGSFRLLWFAGFSIGAVRWLEFLVAGVYVLALTGSALAVALVTTARIIPLALFGILSGALADHVGRRRLYLIGSSGMVAVAAAQAALAFAGLLEVWHVALGAFLHGTFWTTDLPTRRALMGDIAGPPRIAAAMAFDLTTANSTRMFGPFVGGATLELLGIGATFVVGACFYAATAVFTALAPGDPRPAASAARPRFLSSLAEGLKIARAHRLVIGVVTVTLVFNLFAYPGFTMMPVVGRDVLGLTAAQLGLLLACEGAGSLSGSIVIGITAGRAAYGRLYVGGATLYLLMILTLAAVELPLVAALVLFCLGLGGSGFASMQSTLLYVAAPPEARSRVMGLMQVAIGSAPIGFLHVGWLADRFGPQPMLAITAVEGLVALTLVWWRWPELR